MRRLNKLIVVLYRKNNEKISAEEVAKRNATSRKKDVVSIAALVLISFLVCYSVPRIENYQSQSEAGKALIRSTFWYYIGYWEVGTDEEDNQITISFPMKKKIFGYDNLDKYSKSIYAIYKAVKNNFLSKEAWSGYSVNLSFYNGSSSPDYVHVYYIDNNGTNLEVKMEWNGLMEISDIAENFPETKRLYVSYISDITDGLDGFDNLDFLSYYYITNEEKEYVWSIFPNCIIECKDGMCVNE